MKTLNHIKYISLIVIAIGLTSCNEESDFYNQLDNPPQEQSILPELNAGVADFSKYVAIGASFTAGYSDGGMFITAQENSFPNTLSKQFSKVGGGPFLQPLMNDNTGGILVGGIPVSGYRLVFNGAGPMPLNNFLTAQGASVPPITTEATESLALDGSVFNNVGAPGAKSTHIAFNGYAALNPFFGRIATSPTISMLEYAIAQNPTFFTLSEIGGNDVLGYATTGGDGTNPITPSTTFDVVFNAMVDQLTSVCPKGAVTNVPYITDLPHFTTVPHNPIPLDATTANFLNGPTAYGAYNAGLQQIESLGLISAAEREARTITFVEGSNNSVVIMDETLTDLTAINPALVSMRQATEDDLLVLPASSFIGTEAIPGNPNTINGVAVPLADKWVLLPSEQMEIKQATDAYNTTIANVANAKGLALVDLNAVLTNASITGIEFDSYNLTTDLVTGGLVSLDGIHLTARGYALMANEFLKAIDATYGSNFIASGNVAKAEDFGVSYSPMLQ